MGYSAQSIGQTGTWVLVWGGFSADPTGSTSRYTLNGKWCTVYIRNTGAGTSNSATTTVTFPFAAANTGLQFGFGPGLEGVTGVTAMFRTRLNSNIVDILKDVAGNSFANSGVKNAQISSFTYEIA